MNKKIIFGALGLLITAGIVYFSFFNNDCCTTQEACCTTQEACCQE